MLAPIPLPPYCQPHTEVDEDHVEDAGDESDAVEADDALHNSLSLPARLVFIALKLKIVDLDSSSVFFLCFMLPSSSSHFLPN